MNQMSFMGNQRISIKKEIQGQSVITFIDYHRRKPPEAFRFAFLKELIGEKSCMAVIDTTLLYRGTGSHPDISPEDEVEALTKQLEELDISYRKVTVESDSNYLLMGIPIKLNSTKKTINYIVGFVISPENFDKLESISDTFNVGFYVPEEAAVAEELLDHFFAVRGNREELDKGYGFHIYNDNFFLRIRIGSDREKADAVDKIIIKYQP